MRCTKLSDPPFVSRHSSSLRINDTGKTGVMFTRFYPTSSTLIQVEEIRDIIFQSTHSSRPDSYPSPRHYGDRYDDDHSDSRYASRDDDLYSDERYGRDGYKDDEHKGGQEGDYGSRNTGFSRKCSFDDDDRSISVGGRVDHVPRDERELDRRLSEQSSGAPPSYEEATRDVHNHVQGDRNISGVKGAAPTEPSSVPSTNSPPPNSESGFTTCASC
ncbi:hypothetical protein ZIOFF_036620 [Zingiber officinale]|uniref:Uncharacterized protein n=1 Tax=Zingiber officinale TaxID=94328 RepID=A0A8J5GIE9_ZINOF|nr:hypothetical protein ZIOFF_036620 [Zingiber officinale]